MKTLILSDLHLTDKFNIKQFNYLKELITKHDQVIINGDFWDGYLIDIDGFINSSWNKLFPILKEKNTLYIYGNHDHKNWCKDKENFFSDYQYEKLIINIHDQKYLIHHGHNLHNISLHRQILIKNIPREILKIFNYLFEIIPLKIFGPNWKKIYSLQIRRHIKYCRNNLSKDLILICGHLHLAYIDKKNRYYNSGFIQGGYSQYLTITKKGIFLVKDTY